MTGLTAGYASFMVAILVVATAAFTIIRQIGGLDSTDETHDAPSRDEAIRRNVA